MDKKFIPTIYQGWHDYQDAMTKALAPLDAEQLSLRASSDLRSVREIVGHIIGVRALWFQFGETGDKVLVFKPFASWDSKKAKEWSAEARNSSHLLLPYPHPCGYKFAGGGEFAS